MSRPANAKKTRPAKPPSRHTKRREATRQSLVEAAFHLMSERGADAVNINEITEAADVGIGSFYNHFGTKDDLYNAVTDYVFEEFGDALDRLTEGIDDPAEVISVSVRHAILRARREPTWGRFLVRESFSTPTLDRGLGARLLRDVQRGIVAQRFKVEDVLMTHVAVGSTVLGAIAAQQFDEVARKAGLSLDEFAERTAAMVLQILGLRADQAARLARRPLPVVDEASR